MKIWIGTMESGENDFVACCAAIRNSCLKALNNSTIEGYEHSIVSGLPEHEAHAKLYELWNEAKTSFDLFLKVDADTVLMHNNVVTDVVMLFKSNARLTGIQAWLYDHMTDGNIYGLSCMRNTVSLSRINDKLHPDRVDLPSTHDVVLRGDALPRSLIPAGKHCCDANAEQAFRFGIHRALKGQFHIIDRVRIAWKSSNDVQRGFALLGAKQARELSNGLKINYGDEEFKQLFESTKLKYDELIGTL
jgi:hypothetical protein